MKEINTAQYGDVAGGFSVGSCGRDSGGNCNSSGSNSRGGGNGGYQDRSWRTSNRGSGSQANHFGQGGSSFGSSGGCTGGSRARDHVGSNR